MIVTLNRAAGSFLDLDHVVSAIPTDVKTHEHQVTLTTGAVVTVHAAGLLDALQANAQKVAAE